LKQIRGKKVKAPDIFGFEKNLIRETEMKDMKWKARRPRDSSLNNEKAKKLLNEKPVTVFDEIKSIKWDSSFNEI
jgi:dTDP-4-dehydrorhamnose reductase